MIKKLSELFESLSILQISIIAFLGSGFITLIYLFTSDLVTWISSYF